jgi:hypothetical protein
LPGGVAVDEGRSIVHSLGQMGLTVKGLVVARLRSLCVYLLLSPVFFFSRKKKFYLSSGILWAASGKRNGEGFTRREVVQNFYW